MDGKESDQLHLDKNTLYKLKSWYTLKKNIDRASESMDQWIEKKLQKQTKIYDTEPANNHDLNQWISQINTLVDGTSKSCDELSLLWLEHADSYNSRIVGDSDTSQFDKNKLKYLVEMIDFCDKILSSDMEWMNRCVITGFSRTKSAISLCKKSLITINIIKTNYSSVGSISCADRSLLEKTINGIKMIISELMKKNLDETIKEKELWEKIKANNEKKMQEIYSKDFPFLPMDSAIKYLCEHKHDDEDAQLKTLLGTLTLTELAFMTSLIEIYPAIL